MATLSSRRRPKPRETLAAAAVLCAILTLAAWLLTTQARFSPAVTIASLAATAGSALAPAAEPAGAPASPRPPDLLAAWPAGLRPLGPAEQFSPETLSDKIDGKAELYLPAGFVGLRCQRLGLDGNLQSWFEAYVYDMGQPDQAYSVYSSQKRSVTQETAVGDFSYRAANQLCLVHGHFYLELIAADEGAAAGRATDAFAAAFVAATPVTGPTAAARDAALFPREGLVPNSVMLLSTDVFGFDRLNHVFVARYRHNGDEVTLFLSRRASAAEAAELATALRGFLVDDLGGRELPASANVPGVLIDAGGVYDGVFTSGRFLAGVHEATSAAAAERWLARLQTAVTAPPP